MFDIGFWELALLAVIALLVVGPERLPRLARTVGLWLGKGRRIIGNIKDEIDREVRAEEIKKSIEEKMRDSMGETVDTVQDIKRDTEKLMNEPLDNGDDKASPSAKTGP